jgi:ribose transport system substrate-binding protein
MEAALKDPGFSMIEASASQDFYAIPKVAVQVGLGLIDGKKPEKQLILVPSSLVTRQNVSSYKGWNAKHDD